LRRLGWICVIASISFGALTLIALQIVFFELQLNTDTLLIANRILNITALLEITVFLAGLAMLGVARLRQARGQS
jgi:hypothetical protein